VIQVGIQGIEDLMVAGLFGPSICCEQGASREGSKSSESDGFEWKIGFTVVVE